MWMQPLGYREPDVFVFRALTTCYFFDCACLLAKYFRLQPIVRTGQGQRPRNATFALGK